MAKRILALGLVLAFVFNACTDATKQGSAENAKTKSGEESAEAPVKVSYTDKSGKQLEVTFDYSKGIATALLDGKTIELKEQKSASGFWFKNDDYELTGKGNDVVLQKGEQVVFEHKDDIVVSSIKDKDGQTLDITFNKTAGTAKVYLNGGEQIDLVAEKSDSETHYKNDKYELKVKGENYELIKDGKTVFKK